jgi:cell division protein FtsB
MNDFTRLVDTIVNDLSVYKMECIMGFVSAFFFTIVLYGIYNKIVGEELKREIYKKMDVMDQQIAIHHEYNDYYEKLLNYLRNEMIGLRDELIQSNNLVRKYKYIADDLENQVYLSNEFIEKQNQELQKYKEVTITFFENVREIQTKFIEPIMQNKFDFTHPVDVNIKPFNMIETIPEIVL